MFNHILLLFLSDSIENVIIWGIGINHLKNWRLVNLSDSVTSILGVVNAPHLKFCYYIHLK